MNEIVLLEQEEIAPIKDVMGLYELIAKKVMGDNKGEASYDCRKLLVSERIYEAMKRQYKNKMKFAAEWVGYGPKIDYSLRGNMVIVQEGFC